MARKHTKTAQDLAAALNAPVEQVVEIAYRFYGDREPTEADACSWLHSRLAAASRDAFAAAEMAAVHGPEAACLLRRFIRTAEQLKGAQRGLSDLNSELYELFAGNSGPGGGYFADQADAARAAELAHELYLMLSTKARACATRQTLPLDTDVSFDGVRPARVAQITFGKEKY